MTITRTVARPMLASIFVVGATNALRNTSAAAEQARPVAEKLTPLLQQAVPSVPTDTETLVRINAVTQLAAAAALATGRFPRLASSVLAASLGPTTLARHRFWDETDPEARTNQKLHFVKNVALLGALMLASVDTEGQPGVAWRARHAGQGLGRQAKHLKRTAKLEAKLAKKSLGG